MAKLVCEIWDKLSPINGVTAEEMLLRRGCEIPPGGEVYLIRDQDTGRVLVWQPHLPNTSGLVPMTRDMARAVGMTHIKIHLGQLRDWPEQYW